MATIPTRRAADESPLESRRRTWFHPLTPPQPFFRFVGASTPTRCCEPERVRPIGIVLPERPIRDDQRSRDAGFRLELARSPLVERAEASGASAGDRGKQRRLAHPRRPVDDGDRARRQ